MSKIVKVLSCSFLGWFVVGVGVLSTLVTPHTPSARAPQGGNWRPGRLQICSKARSQQALCPLSNPGLAIGPQSWTQRPALASVREEGWGNLNPQGQVGGPGMWSPGLGVAPGWLGLTMDMSLSLCLGPHSPGGTRNAVPIWIPETSGWGSSRPGAPGSPQPHSLLALTSCQCSGPPGAGPARGSLHTGE